MYIYIYVHIYILCLEYIYICYIKKTSSLPLFFRQPQPRSLGDVPRAIRTDHHLALWPPSLQGERCCRGRLHLWPSCRRLWPSCRRRRLRPGHLLRPRRRSRLGLRATATLLLHLGRRLLQGVPDVRLPLRRRYSRRGSLRLCIPPHLEAGSAPEVPPPPAGLPYPPGLPPPPGPPEERKWPQ